MTKAPISEAKVVTLTINGQAVSGRSDETILDIARQNDIRIPTLCFLDGLSGWGSCRMCLVQLAGTPKLLPACVTKVTDGMEVTTHNERLIRFRKMVLEMLFAERNHICSVCFSNGHCELQTLATEHGITHIHMPYLYEKFECDSSHDLFRIDHNRCVMCTRCIRVCDEIEGAHTFDLAGRGDDTRVIIDLNLAWGESETCTSCGKCVRVCPTGALTRKGTASSEMVKDASFLAHLALTRGNNA